MYLDITDPRNNPKKFMMRGRSIILNPRIKFVPTHEAISWKLAPQIFRVVMTSFAAVRCLYIYDNYKLPYILTFIAFTSNGTWCFMFFYTCLRRRKTSLEF